MLTAPEDLTTLLWESLATSASSVSFCWLQARSLLTAHEDFTTLLFKSPEEIQRPGFVFSTLKKHLPDATVEEVKRMSLTADNRSAVFDVPSKLAKVSCCCAQAD